MTERYPQSRHPAPLPAEIIESLLGQVAERRMSQVVSQTCCLSRVRIKATQRLGFVHLLRQQFFGHAPSQLRHFERVREAIVEGIAFASGYDLSHFRQTGECTRIQDPVPVYLRGAPIVFAALAVTPFLPYAQFQA